MKNVEEDIIAQDRKIGGMVGALQKRYKDRKSEAKNYFLEKAGGYEDVEGAKQRPPEDMNPENWIRAVDHFCSPEHKQKSEINKVVRRQQTNTYRGGTSSFATHCYKKVYTHTYT